MKVEIKGMQECLQILKGIPEKVQRKTLRKAAQQGGNILYPDIYDATPVETGDLKDNCKIKMSISRKKGLATAEVSYGKGWDKHSGWQFYGSFLLYGYTDRAGVWHDGKDWITPEVEKDKLKAVQAISNYLRQHLYWDIKK